MDEVLESITFEDLVKRQKEKWELGQPEDREKQGAKGRDREKKSKNNK
jgi:hypothetical protein